MAINPYHIVEEINGIRCSIIEKKVSAERAAFVKSILESSGQEVLTRTEEDASVTIGVTNIVFNAVHALYARTLKTADKKVVTPAQWYQKQQTDQFYWNYK
jgi:hypothetical protein